MLPQFTVPLYMVGTEVINHGFDRCLLNQTSSTLFHTIVLPGFLQ